VGAALDGGETTVGACGPAGAVEAVGAAAQPRAVRQRHINRSDREDMNGHVQHRAKPSAKRAPRTPEQPSSAPRPPDCYCAVPILLARRHTARTSPGDRTAWRGPAWAASAGQEPDHRRLAGPIRTEQRRPPALREPSGPAALRVPSASARGSAGGQANQVTGVMHKARRGQGAFRRPAGRTRCGRHPSRARHPHSYTNEVPTRCLPPCSYTNDGSELVKGPAGTSAGPRDAGGLP